VDPEARTERQNILKDKRFLKDYDMRLRRLDGSVLWVEDNVRVIYHADCRMLYYEGSLRDITERKKMEEILKVSARQWQTTFEGINDAIFLLDMEGKILQCNKAMATLLGKSFSEIIGSICCKLVHGTSGPIEGCPRIRMRETRSRENLVLSLEDRWFNVSSDPILDETDHLIGAVHIISDITERKRAEDEREKLIQELQKALAEVKTLSGLIPICASCKKIRDDKGYWNQIESYIRDHSEAEFSHSICPECMKKLYPDFSKDTSQREI
jgi:PAS domain S-box-containing protein